MKLPFSVRFTIPYYRNPILYTCPEQELSRINTFPVYHQTVPCFNLSAIMQKQEGSYLPNAEELTYLCNKIKSSDGSSFPMVGLLNQSATMVQMKLRSGIPYIIL